MRQVHAGAGSAGRHLRGGVAQHVERQCPPARQAGAAAGRRGRERGWWGGRRPRRGRRDPAEEDRRQAAPVARYAIAEYFTRRGREFLAAAERPADGVTIIVTVRHNSMLQVLQRALRGDAVGSALALTRALLVSADVAIKTEAGFRS